MRRLKLIIGPVTLVAELFDTPSAAAIWNAAPFDARAETWGEEVYFTTPISRGRTAWPPHPPPATRGAPRRDLPHEGRG